MGSGDNDIRHSEVWTGVSRDRYSKASAKWLDRAPISPPSDSGTAQRLPAALLLSQHHNFFLPSQHPGVAAALGRLAAKYAMPARMWRHSIHSFVGLLRDCVPWAPGLSVLGISYGMTMVDIKSLIHTSLQAQRSVPTTGRLYHHLAILPRPNGFPQLFTIPHRKFFLAPQHPDAVRV